MAPDDFSGGLLGALSGALLNEMSRDGRVYDPAAPMVLGPRRTASGGVEPSGFGVIRDGDANFDTTAFYRRVGDTFLNVHASMDSGNLDRIRHLVQSHVFDELRDRCGYPTGPLAITRCQALAVVRHGGQDHIRIRIVAKPQNGGDVVQEYWSFSRDAGARSKADPSLYKCPNCGAPLDGGDRVRCQYCGVQLCDPALDWVVDKISVDD